MARFNEDGDLVLRDNERALVSFVDGGISMVIEYEHLQGGVWMRDLGRTDLIGRDRITIIASR